MLPPLVERELRVALLRRNARKQWLLAARTAGGVTLLSMLVLGLAANRPGGRTLFHWLFALGIVGMIKRGFGLTADLFSEERRNGTLGLVVLTGLQPLEIFVCKLLGALLLASFALLGGLPCFAIPFLAGGVTPSEFLCALTFLANGLFFCVAVGLLASVLHRDGGQAQLTAQAVAATLCVATPLLRWFTALAGRPGLFPSTSLTLSPAYPAYLLFNGFGARSPHVFWVGSAITLAYSLTALLLAALLLERTWRDGPKFVLPGTAASWRVWVRGGPKWRDRLRARLLVDEPFCWFAARDRAPLLAAYGVLAAAGSIWLVGWVASGTSSTQYASTWWTSAGSWLTPANAFISSIVLHLALNFVGAYAAGRRFAEERLSGGFEILLTAPLKASEIVEGQNKALLVQFRTAALTTLLFDAVLCWSGWAGLNGSKSVTLAYFSAWVLMLGFWFATHLATASCAMWISAWTGRPGYAALKAASGQMWLWMFWMWVIAQHGWRASFQANPNQMLLFVGLLVFPILVTFSRRFVLRQKLTKELRLIASAPVPARGDRRFKKWDPDKIYPPGPWGDLVLRPATKRQGR